MIFPHNVWYIGNVLVSAHFSLKLAHGTYCLRSNMQLFILLGIVLKISPVTAQPVLWWLYQLYYPIYVQGCHSK